LAHGVLCWVPEPTAVRAVTASNARLDDGAASDAMSGARGDVLEADLARGDETVAVVGDSYLPQLLGSALLDRTSVDRDPSVGHGAKEVGVVVDADGDEAVFLRSGRRAGTGRGFDGGGVDAAVDESPGLVVLGAEVDPAGDV
jgi:hypothetical protein